MSLMQARCLLHRQKCRLAVGSERIEGDDGLGEDGSRRVIRDLSRLLGRVCERICGKDNRQWTARRAKKL